MLLSNARIPCCIGWVGGWVGESIRLGFLVGVENQENQTAVKGSNALLCF